MTASMKISILKKRQRLQKTKEKIQQRYERFYNKWIDYDLLTCILAMIGLIVAILDHEYMINIDIQNRLETVVGNFVRVLIAITSVLAIISITIRHYSKTEWINYPLPKDLQMQIYNQTRFDSSRNREEKRLFITIWFLLEVLLIAIFPLPYFDYQFQVQCIDKTTGNTTYIKVPYQLSDFQLAFMFARIILLIRSIFNYTMFTDLYAKKLCESYGFTANVRFTFKCFIIKYPGLTVVCTLSLSVLILGYILRIFEIPYYHAIGQKDFDTFFAAVWCIVVTMTTVGFGDIVPYSVFGRVVIMITAIWGAFLISLLIVSVSNIFQLNRNQKRAMHHLFLTRKAASSITAAMKYFLAKRRYEKRLKTQEQVNDNKIRQSVDNNVPIVFGSKEEELMVLEKVEEQDLRDMRKLIDHRLLEFRDEMNELKSLSIQLENEQEYQMHRIKSEVIELRHRFDDMTILLESQNKMLEYLVQKQSSSSSELIPSQRQQTSMFQLVQEEQKKQTQQ